MTKTPPTTIGRYFWEETSLTPLIPEKQFWRAKWVISLKLKLAKLYWKKTNPYKYAKCVCSLMVTALYDVENEYIVPGNGTIRAPAKAPELTERIGDATTTIIRGQAPTNMLPILMKEMSWFEWADLHQVTTHVWAQANFVWTLVSALESGVQKDEPAMAETLSILKTWMPPYVSYIEDLLQEHITQST